MRRRDIALGMAALIAATAGVGLLSASPEEQLVSEADAAARNVRLARVTGSKLEDAGGRRLRVLVTLDGVSVDGTAMVGAWPEATRDAVRRKLSDTEPLMFFAREVSPLSSAADGRDEGIMRRLLAVLENAHSLDVLRASIEGPDAAESQASVLIDGDLTFTAVVPVLYTIGESNYAPRLIVQAPGALREIVLDVPRYRAATGDYAELIPEITLGPDGPSVRLRGGNPAAYGLESTPGQHGAPSTSIRGKLVLDEDRRCPSAPGEIGAYDHTRLERVLRMIRDRVIAPRSSPAAESAVAITEELYQLENSNAVLIIPDPTAQWREIAIVADIAADAGYSSIRLGAVREPLLPVSELSCRDGVVASDLQAGDADFFTR